MAGASFCEPCRKIEKPDSALHTLNILQKNASFATSSTWWASDSVSAFCCAPPSCPLRKRSLSQPQRKAFSILVVTKVEVAVEVQVEVEVEEIQIEVKVEVEAGVQVEVEVEV